jgi:hypothetical protein
LATQNYKEGMLRYLQHSIILSVIKKLAKSPQKCYCLLPLVIGAILRVGPKFNNKVGNGWLSCGKVSWRGLTKKLDVDASVLILIFAN